MTMESQLARELLSGLEMMSTRLFHAAAVVEPHPDHASVLTDAFNYNVAKGWAIVSDGRSSPPLSWDTVITMRQNLHDYVQGRAENREIQIPDQLHPASENDFAAAYYAANIATAQVATALEQLNTPQSSLEVTKQSVIDAINGAHVTLKNLPLGMSSEGKGYASVAVCQVIQVEEGRKNAVIGSVGNCRVYRYRAGKLDQLTLDDIPYPTTKLQDSWALQKRLAEIGPADYEGEQDSSLLDRRDHPSQLVGNAAIDPQVVSVDFDAGDVLLLTTDAVPHNLTDQEILGALQQGTNLVEMRESLIRLAKTRMNTPGHLRKKVDGMGVVLLSCTS